MKTETGAGASATVNKKVARVLLVDDCPLVGVGFTSLFRERDKSLRICAVTNDLETTLSEIERWSPRLLILEIQLERTSGNELLQEVKRGFPTLPILVFTRRDDHPYAMKMFKVGASGFLNKNAEVDEIIEAVDKVLNGEPYASHSVVMQMFNFLVGRKARGSTPPEVLSPTELEVFERIGNGKSSSQIAEERGLSVKTIETHRAHIKKKLGLKEGVQLIATAVAWHAEHN